MVKRRPAADRLASKRRADRCSGLIKQATAVPISLPHRLRDHGPGSTVEETDCTGDRIVMLAQRSDVQAVRHISKKLYKTLGRTPEFMKWCLLAQRLYDPISLERVFVPFVLENQAFTKKNLTRLHKHLEAACGDSFSLVSNPTGSAAAFSGPTTPDLWQVLYFFAPPFVHLHVVHLAQALHERTQRETTKKSMTCMPQQSENTNTPR